MLGYVNELIHNSGIFLYNKKDPQVPVHNKPLGGALNA